MPRWIIPASVAAILISLAVLGILLAANSSAPPEDVADVQQSEEPEVPPQTVPEQTTEGEELTVPEGASEGEQTTSQDAPVPTPGPETASVEITGGSSYYCSLGVIGEPETIQGREPASYEVEVATGGTSLDTVMAACQKISAGTLGVRINYDGEIVAQDETDARLGTISVSWNPLEE